MEVPLMLFGKYGCQEHIFRMDDMVIVNWKELAECCESGREALIRIQHEIITWRANWRPRPDYDEFQNIVDELDALISSA